MKTALEDTFLEMDNLIRAPSGMRELASILGQNYSSEFSTMAGATSVVALMVGGILYVANAGDSRCVLARGGRAIEMSIDHKPELEEERNRIITAG